MIMTKESEKLGGKPVPVPLCPQIHMDWPKYESRYMQLETGS
jgi:hypothetical protein